MGVLTEGERWKQSCDKVGGDGWGCKQRGRGGNKVVTKLEGVGGGVDRGG